MDIFQVKVSHYMAGRLRLRMAELKGDPDAAARVEEVLGGVPGITSVETSALTGSVLISYHRRQILTEEAAQALAEALETLFPDLDVARLLVWLVSLTR
jgi:copper chaperone CopZ